VIQAALHHLDPPPPAGPLLDHAALCDPIGVAPLSYAALDARLARRALHLTRDPDMDQARLTDLLAGWLHRRKTSAPPHLESGWGAATTAWAVHLRTLTGYPPPSVLTRAVQLADADGDAFQELMTNTRVGTAALFTRLERPERTRTELVEHWHAVAALAAAVPVLHQIADRLLDQIACATRTRSNCGPSWNRTPPTTSATGPPPRTPTRRCWMRRAPHTWTRPAPPSAPTSPPPTQDASSRHSRSWTPSPPRPGCCNPAAPRTPAARHVPLPDAWPAVLRVRPALHGAR
jgi:hypothetical protein